MFYRTIMKKWESGNFRRTLFPLHLRNGLLPLPLLLLENLNTDQNAKTESSMTLSTGTRAEGAESIMEVASTGPGIWFFQLYISLKMIPQIFFLSFVCKDRNVVAQLVRRAERAGFKAIALTVDTPRLGRREADIKNRFTLPPFLTLKNFEGLNLGTMDKSDDSRLASYVASQIDRTLISWILFQDVKWLQTITRLQILVKGVLTTEDTRLAIQVGTAGIIVSNHEALQLDYVPATIVALEEVVKVTQGRVPVFVDGGIRQGTYVFKALALRASCIFSTWDYGMLQVSLILSLIQNSFICFSTVESVKSRCKYNYFLLFS
ncbi:hypothetical protein UlMin_013422 [Ulmus minor]